MKYRRNMKGKYSVYRHILTEISIMMIAVFLMPVKNVELL